MTKEMSPVTNHAQCCYADFLINLATTDPVEQKLISMNRGTKVLVRGPVLNDSTLTYEGYG